MMGLLEGTGYEGLDRGIWICGARYEGLQRRARFLDTMQEGKIIRELAGLKVNCSSTI